MLSITFTWDMLSPEESISHWVLRSSHRGDITYRTAKEQRPLIGRGAREKELTAMPLCNAPPLKFHSGMFLQRPYEKRTPLGILWYTHDTILSWCRLVLGEPFLQSPWSLRNARLSDGYVENWPNKKWKPSLCDATNHRSVSTYSPLWHKLISESS